MSEPNKRQSAAKRGPSRYKINLVNPQLEPHKQDMMIMTTMFNRQSNNSRSKLTGVMSILIPLLCNRQITRILVPSWCLFSLVFDSNHINSFGDNLYHIKKQKGHQLWNHLHQSPIGYHIDQVTKSINGDFANLGL